MYRVWYRNLKVWLKHARASLIGNLGQPFLFLLAMGYGLGRHVPEIEGLPYLQFIAPGLVTTAVMYSAAFETTYGSYTRLTTQSTFEGILMTPVSALGLAAGEIVWGATKGLIAGLIMLSALPLFGVIPSSWAGLLVPILFVEGIFFAAVGLIMTALASSYEFFNYFTSLIITPLFLFSGIFFSLNTLDPMVRTAIEIFPLAHIVNLSRMLCYGHIREGWMTAGAVTVLTAAVAMWLGMILLKRRLIR
jgi:lipooligosaccharide transport system permease protein